MTIQELTTEVEKVSVAYADHFEIKRDKNWFILKLQEELGELIQSYLMMSGQARVKNKTPEQLEADFKAEVADVFCHVLLLAKHTDVELEAEIKQKWMSRIEKR
ncbi:MAG: pyrophosphatase [bacterium]|nr:pyrophosphatase [bacterium]